MEELGKELGNTSIFGEQKKEKSVIMEAEKKSPGKEGKDGQGGSKGKNTARDEVMTVSPVTEKEGWSNLIRKSSLIPTLQQSMAGRIQTNESLKILNGELKKRCRMEKSTLYYGSSKSAIGPEEKAIRKGEITNGEL